MGNQITPKQKLEIALKYHDWHYEYADDHSVWKTGHQQSLQINELIKEANLPEEELKELVGKYKPKDFKQ